MNNSLLGQEWQTLQNCHEQHEKNALLIKLVCVGLCVVGLGLRVPLVWLGFCVVLLWGQEAIFKTYQGRIAQRLVLVEGLLAMRLTDASAMQLHSEWQLARPGFLRLIGGYGASACKPTVAFPYVGILLVGAGSVFLAPSGG
jgi:hypothetical protein